MTKMFIICFQLKVISFLILFLPKLKPIELSNAHFMRSLIKLLSRCASVCQHPFAASHSEASLRQSRQMSHKFYSFAPALRVSQVSRMTISYEEGRRRGCTWIARYLHRVAAIRYEVVALKRLPHVREETKYFGAHGEASHVTLSLSSLSVSVFVYLSLSPLSYDS